MGTKARTTRNDPAEYRRYLDERLARTRARIKMADAVTGLTIVVVTWVCYLLLVVMLDQIVELPSFVRFLLLVTCLIVTGGILVLRVLLPSLNQINTRFAARSIENADQRMKNSVLSWVELSEHPEDLPTPILRTIENKAASDLSRVRIEDAIQPRHVLSALYVLAAVVVLFCLYSFFTTKSFGASIERVLLPLGATAPPTATQLRLTFDPGQADPTEPTPIPADSSITFKASVVRGNPAQVMAYLQAEGSDYEEPHELARSSEVQSEFTLSLHQRQKTFRVRFVANDFQSKQYTIAVTPAPMITEWLLRYTPPSYTGAAPFTSPTPDITGLEGTEVTVEASTNLPVAPNSARIEFKLARPMASVDMKLMEGTENRIEGKFTLTGDGSYSVLFSDKEGRSPLFRPSNNIRVLKDLPPAIEFTRPAEVESLLPANQPLILAARVKDDIGLRHIMLTIRKKGSEDAPIIFEQGGRPGDVLGQSESINESVDLSKFKLIPGDVVEYWIEAEDNKLPASNTASTRADSRIVKITKPIEEAPPSKDGERKEAGQSDDNDLKKTGDKTNEPSPKDDEKAGDQPSDSNDKNTGNNTDRDDKANPDADTNKDEPPNEANDSNGTEKGDKPSAEDATAKDLKESGKEGKRQQSDGKTAADESEGKLSEEDSKDLERLQEYYKKKEGSKGAGNAKENSKSPSESKDRENAKPSKDNNSEQNTGEQENSNNNEAGSDKSTSPSGTKPGNDTSSADTQKSEGSNESSDSKQPSEKKQAEEEQKQPTAKGDKAKSSPSDKSGEMKKDDAQPNGDNTVGKDEEKEEAGTKNEKPADGKDSTASEKKEPSANEDEKKSSEPQTGRKPTDENQNSTKGDNSKTGSQGEEKSSSKDDASKSPQKSDSSKSPGNDQSSPNSGDSKKSDDSQGKPSSNQADKSKANENSSSKEGDSLSEEKQPKAGSEGKPNSSGEKKPSSAGEKQSGQESQSQSGESGSSDDSSSKDGKQNKESKEGKPTPGSDGESNKPSKRSTKIGNDESSAASKGNSDGSSQEGPSESPGQKGPGSPSDQKGNESKGPGDQEKSSGQQPSGKNQQGGSKSTEGEKQEENENQAGEKQPSGEKPSSSNGTGKEGQKSSDGKTSSDQQKGSEGSKPSGNSSESKEGSPSNEKSGSESPGSSESSENKSPPKEEEKSADSKDSGSSDTKQSKQPNENSSKGSANSNDSKDAKPSDNASKNGTSDAQQTGPANQPSGGKRANPTGEKGNGGVLDNSGDQADPEDLKKGSNLILKKLEDQLANKKVDPDLLKSMGWTEEDARKFYERMKKEQSPADNVAPLEREQRRQFGKGTDLRKSTGKGAGTKNDSIQDLYSGRRTPVPPQVRKRFEAYMKSLSETSSGKPADKLPAQPAAGTK